MSFFLNEAKKTLCSNGEGKIVNKKYDNNFKIAENFHIESVQSPISISIRESKIKDNEKPLEYHGHWTHDGIAFIENTGTSARVIFQRRKQQPYICGGPLPPNQRYIFAELHFHWAEHDNAGCEHIVNGQT